MAETDQNVDIYQGEDKELHITIYDDEGNARTLEDGCTARTVITRRYSDEIVLEVEGEIVSGVGDASDYVKVLLTSQDTRDLSGDYRHETRVLDTYGNQSVPTVGNLRVFRSTTLTDDSS